MSAALAVYQSLMDVFVAVVEQPQTFAIAIAASVTAGGFAAVPLKKDGSSYRPAEDKVLPASSFLADGHETFLLSSGITENLSHRGVRFRPCQDATVDTLLLKNESPELGRRIQRISTTYKWPSVPLLRTEISRE